MSKNDDLISENIILHSRLALAEKWMRREVQNAIALVKRDGLKKNTRRHFENIFQEEGIEIITKRILDIFGESLHHAPKYTLERLIDAEIYWETLQRYPRMDALPIILAYQKILDAWIEKILVAPFRKDYEHNPSPRKSLNPLDNDIENIVSKDYTLSLGRLYQILDMARKDEKYTPYTQDIITYWKLYRSDVFHMLISDAFFLPFSGLMDREIFSKKRHEEKVSFSDAKKVRDVLVQDTKSGGLLNLLIGNSNKSI